MADFCCECTFYESNKPPKWGNEHYCIKERKYYPPTKSACREFIKRDEKNGYQRAGCYITTIVCTIMGYDDNCELLQVLRNFRESYLKQFTEYLPLLIEYDQIGPVISNKLLQEENSKLAAIELLRNFLIPCANSIKIGNNDEAITIYKNMVTMLKIKYGLFNISIDYDIKTSIEELGKGRIRAQLKTVI